jgi:tripartite-type tricarboxylate transporter receptor subunit TctC
VIEKINADVNAALKEKDLSERLAGLGAEVLTGTPGDFADYIAREIPKWTKVVKDSGARAD